MVGQNHIFMNGSILYTPHISGTYAIPTSNEKILHVQIPTYQVINSSPIVYNPAMTENDLISSFVLTNEMQQQLLMDPNSMQQLQTLDTFTENDYDDILRSPNEENASGLDSQVNSPPGECSSPDEMLNNSFDDITFDDFFSSHNFFKDDCLENCVDDYVKLENSDNEDTLMAHVSDSDSAQHDYSVESSTNNAGNIGTPPPSPQQTSTESSDLKTNLNPPKKQTSTKPPRNLECYNCGVNKTPLWRRTPDRMHSLCNACGLYYKQYNTHRPLHIRNKPTNSNAPYTLPVSRKSTISSVSSESSGQPICNACGLYAKLHNRDRPAAMRKAKIQRRRRDWGGANGNSNGLNLDGSVSDGSCDSNLQLPTSPNQHPITIQLTGQRPIMPLMIPQSQLTASPITMITSIPASVQHNYGAGIPYLSYQVGLDESGFKSSVSKMPKDQIEEFLENLERQCCILKEVLVEDQNY
ncbi:62_t:CDS:2 [Scutellospora calospora]|uniref:62_t:CDS:1 n=1 Tax=Scutellospora calospora TaxID=85575 RepID=A0ACA9L2F9_9GLOM|nr:62_t:CDS:2 [Scutellospora calospora]